MVSEGYRRLLMVHLNFQHETQSYLGDGPASEHERPWGIILIASFELGNPIPCCVGCAIPQLGSWTVDMEKEPTERCIVFFLRSFFSLFIRKVSRTLVNCCGLDWIGDCPHALMTGHGHPAISQSRAMPCKAHYGWTVGSGVGRDSNSGTGT